MPKKRKPPPSYAPVYAALYPKLATLAREYGYALAVHGSMQRDLDLVAIPWTDSPDPPGVVVDAIEAGFALRRVGEPEERRHGRIIYTMSIGHGQCFLDLSFMPVVTSHA